MKPSVHGSSSFWVQWAAGVGDIHSQHLKAFLNSVSLNEAFTGWWSQEYPRYFLTDIEKGMLLRHFTPWPLQPGTAASFPGWRLGEIRPNRLCYISGSVLHVDFRDGSLLTGILTQEREAGSLDHPFQGSPSLPPWLQVLECPLLIGSSLSRWPQGEGRLLRLRQMWDWM